MNKVHANIECDVCLEDNIVGIRYACLVCADYDLCEKCYEARGISQQHKPYHPMQAILQEDEFFETLEGVAPDELLIFCCPYCGDRELSGRDLMQHCRQYHNSGGHPVRCPICLIYKMEMRLLLSDTTLLDHLLNRHQEYCCDSVGELSCSQVIQECTICMENMMMNSSNSMRLLCGHQFHTTCINEWLKQNLSCPICRAAQCAVM